MTDGKNDELREELREERKKAKKEKEKETPKEDSEPLFDEIDVINTISGAKKIHDAIKKKPDKSKEEEEEEQRVKDEQEAEEKRLKMVIDILMEDIESEDDPEEKANLKKQLTEKVGLYLSLKKSRDDREAKNKRSGIDWEKVLEVLGVAVETLGPTALKLVMKLIKKKK